MKARTVVAVAVAALLLVGGAAMVGAASPADQANETAGDAYEEHAPDDAGPGAHAGPPADVGPSDASGEADVGASNAGDANGNTSEESNTNESSVGPSDGLPEQVPDHVSTIHDTIESFLHGEIDHLGEALSDLLSNGENDNGNETDGEAVGSGAGA